MRLLMCPPDYFDVSYEINPWMHMINRPDRDRAQRQWEALHRILTDAVAVGVDLVTPQPGLPDMVFTANAGLVQEKTFVPSRFRFAERQGEVSHFTRWFESQGFDIKPLPDDIFGAFEGEGDALFYGEILLTGYGQRSQQTACHAAGTMLGRKTLTLELVDSRWYHLDTCLFPLSSELLAYYPLAFSSESQDALKALPGEKLLLNEHDALQFGCNAVVIGNHVVLNVGCDALTDSLMSHGYAVHAADLSEFLKSGGSAKCLALHLENP